MDTKFAIRKKTVVNTFDTSLHTPTNRRKRLYSVIFDIHRKHEKTITFSSTQYGKSYPLKNAKSKQVFGENVPFEIFSLFKNKNNYKEMIIND